MTIGLWEMASYAGALLILFLTPGPVWVALTARALSGGFHAAWPLALGVVVGDVLWPFLAILGVTWIVSVFAGFMTHTDHHLGRLFDFLEEIGVAEDTVVMILSDNGASAEGGPTGTPNEAAGWIGLQADEETALGQIEDLGGHDASNHYPWGWAWAGNTPLRLWKRYSWLGGVRAPLVLRWPSAVPDPGAVRGQFTHAVDLRGKLGRHRRALGLVLLVLGVPEHGARRVEGDGAVGGVPGGKGLEEGVHEAVDALYLLTGGPYGQRRLDGGPGPVHDSVAVDHEKQRPIV